MNSFVLSSERFFAIKDQLTERLAVVLEQKLVSMGEDAKWIDWFSSLPHDSTEQLQAA